MENDAIIKIQDLYRSFEVSEGFFKKTKKKVDAVNGISFEVQRGEVFGLLGPNGAGKTTTIKIMTTLLAPTSGECKIFGCKSFGEEKSIRPRINFIFGGEMGVYRRLSGRDNLVYFSNLYKISLKDQKDRIDRLLEMVGLIDAGNRRVETYSKGMIQRLQIARGLINDPEILFMDEPTIGLDPVGARRLRDIISQLKSAGKTILLTTHYMAEAEELCDHVAIINKGKIVANDTVESLKQRFGNGSESLEDIYVKLIEEL